MKNEGSCEINDCNDEYPNFPRPSQLSTDWGAVSNGLSDSIILSGYKKGYFPWYYKDGLWYWFHPEQRMVLFPDEIKISKSMRPLLNGNKFRFRIDHDFEKVIASCRTIERRDGQTTSWINDEIMESYTRLFHSGVAHCAEAWVGNRLAGGLYGLWIGDVFFGESMFSTESNASKFAFIKYVTYLKKEGVKLIDCQQQTQHMASLGARPVARKEFVHYLEKLIPENDNIW